MSVNLMHIPLTFLLLILCMHFQVWRFCITFADVLGLWPFTLDEFIQAFHDYVSSFFWKTYQLPVFYLVV